jgi:hypothetical protein
MNPDPHPHKDFFLDPHQQFFDADPQHCIVGKNLCKTLENLRL